MAASMLRRSLSILSFLLSWTTCFVCIWVLSLLIRRSKWRRSPAAMAVLLLMMLNLAANVNGAAMSTMEMILRNVHLITREERPILCQTMATFTGIGITTGIPATFFPAVLGWIRKRVLVDGKPPSIRRIVECMLLMIGIGALAGVRTIIDPSGVIEYGRYTSHNRKVASFIMMVAVATIILVYSVYIDRIIIKNLRRSSSGVKNVVSTNQADRQKHDDHVVKLLHRMLEFQVFSMMVLPSCVVLIRVIADDEHLYLDQDCLRFMIASIALGHSYLYAKGQIKHSSSSPRPLSADDVGGSSNGTPKKMNNNIISIAGSSSNII